MASQQSRIPAILDMLYQGKIDRISIDTPATICSENSTFGLLNHSLYQNPDVIAAYEWSNVHDKEDNYPSPLMFISKSKNHNAKYDIYIEQINHFEEKWGELINIWLGHYDKTTIEKYLDELVVLGAGLMDEVGMYL